MNGLSGEDVVVAALESGAHAMERTFLAALQELKDKGIEDAKVIVSVLDEGGQVVYTRTFE